MSEDLTKELFYDIVAINKPKLICTDQFDFSDVHNFDYAFAQSLFTHHIRKISRHVCTIYPK